ncbi:RsmF rRNA methyltransferase first C-terminal domain-containing protein [Levilactobacillus suantsaii]|uniref:RNA methyltransferase n=1 Tax=Levilactobacillus suantsaii TaxID=2292255 RepID=A0A4Q0VIN8_9LACO|nr:RsmB/NOP family class I SAM-dependent RNA methyltransferase [Levilactobacillus suantsaii]QMU07728.1 RsmF rRNA methyltransferase first C-terminal domain-containing protein [Levilactobacillus suantsaii]RXI79357.1 RNA methyltransferase [Levilactobacillus suantsaii]
MNLPDDFVTKYQHLLGTEAPAFLASLTTGTTTAGYRVNPQRQLSAKLTAAPRVPYAPWGYYGTVKGRSLAHQSGAVYSQEPSAMFVGATAAPQPGERVLDLCAAPGGKTTHLASYLQGSGLLVTNEINRKRVRVLAENVERFGTANALILNDSPDTLSPIFPDYFDKVLVDAPCSGEGMFRKDPAAMDYWSLAYVEECAARQREILTEAVKMVKPGGQLIYSTCTFAPEEDEQMMAWVLKTFPEFSLVPVEKSGGVVDARPEWADGNPDLKRAARLFPHLLKGEGHFVAKLQRATTAEAKRVHGQAQLGQALTGAQRKLWQDFAQQVLGTVPAGDLVTIKDQLFLTPAQLPALTGAHVFRPGLHLGTFKKNRFEPAYALALASDPQQVAQTLTIDSEQWQQWVHGDALTLTTAPAKGWYLLTCDQQPVGFGKVVQKTVKNFFPKGLRFTVYPEDLT